MFVWAPCVGPQACRNKVGYLGDKPAASKQLMQVAVRLAVAEKKLDHRKLMYGARGLEDPASLQLKSGVGETERSLDVPEEGAQQSLMCSEDVSHLITKGPVRAAGAT